MGDRSPTRFLTEQLTVWMVVMSGVAARESWFRWVMSETAQECGPHQRVWVGCDARHGWRLPWSSLSLAHSLQHPQEPAYKFRRKRRATGGGAAQRFWM